MFCFFLVVCFVLCCVVVFVFFFSPFLADFWQDIGNRRAFFETYAASNNFDHLNADSWYELHPNEITTNKVHTTLAFL